MQIPFFSSFILKSCEFLLVNLDLHANAEERVWSDRGHIGFNMIVNHGLARGIISLASLFSCSLEKLL